MLSARCRGDRRTASTANQGAHSSSRAAAGYPANQGAGPGANTRPAKGSMTLLYALGFGDIRDYGIGPAVECDRVCPQINPVPSAHAA